MFNSDGSIVFTSDDISHAEIENHEWIDKAMVDFFEQTGYKNSDVPYFVKRDDFAVTPEMKKINAIMVRYCAFCITDAIQNNTDLSPTTGNKRYSVQKAVNIIFGNFNALHIVYAVKNHWLDIDAPYSVKTKFYETVEKMRKSPKGKPKRSTPEEDFKRLKAKEEAKGANNAGNGQDSLKPISNQNREIMHIIDSYKNGLKAKPKNTTSDLPSMKKMSQTSKKLR